MLCTQVEHPLMKDLCKELTTRFDKSMLNVPPACVQIHQVLLLCSVRSLTLQTIDFGLIEGANEDSFCIYPMGVVEDNVHTPHAFMLELECHSQILQRKFWNPASQ